MFCLSLIHIYSKGNEGIGNHIQVFYAISPAASCGCSVSCEGGNNPGSTKAAGIRVSDGIQEALENVREIRATNQEERYLAGLNRKIDEHERRCV